MSSHLRWKLRRIARETGFHRATIRMIARELGPDVQSVPEVATDSPGSRSSCKPHRTFIEAEVAKGRDAVATAHYFQLKTTNPSPVAFIHPRQRRTFVAFGSTYDEPPPPPPPMPPE